GARRPSLRGARPAPLVLAGALSFRRRTSGLSAGSGRGASRTGGLRGDDERLGGRGGGPRPGASAGRAGQGMDDDRPEPAVAASGGAAADERGPDAAAAVGAR